MAAQPEGVCLSVLEISRGGTIPPHPPTHHLVSFAVRKLSLHRGKNPDGAAYAHFL